MSIFLLLPLLLTYTPPVSGTTLISSGFGDFRRVRTLHFHNAVDIPASAGTYVYYPGGEAEYYDPEVVSITTMSSNQTNYLIIGRFCFTHLLTGGHPPKPLIIALGITDTSKQNWLHRNSWINLWRYCKNNGIPWREGLEVGVVAKDHLHFGELLIPNIGRAGNIWINPLWRDLITVRIGNREYRRYGYLEGVDDVYGPAAEVVTNLHGALRGYRIMEKNNSQGVWDLASWVGQARSGVSGSRINTVNEWRKYYYDAAPKDTSFWLEDSVWCPVVGDGHAQEIEFIGRIYDGVNTPTNRVIPFELRGAIIPWKAQDRLLLRMPLINGMMFGMTRSVVRGYAWAVKKFDTISDSWFNNEDSVKSFYYRSVSFVPSNDLFLVQSGDSVKWKRLPELIGNSSTESTTLRRFYVNFTHGYKEAVSLGNIRVNYYSNISSPVLPLVNGYYPGVGYGESYRDYYYPDGLYFFSGSFIDVNGEFWTGHPHYNTTRTAFIIDNVHDPRWFLQADVKFYGLDLQGIVTGEATEPLVGRRFYVDTTNNKKVIKPMPRDSFVKISMYVVKKTDPQTTVGRICSPCEILSMQPGVYTPAEKDSVYVSPHIRIKTSFYRIPANLLLYPDSLTVRIDVKVWNFKDLAGNTPVPSSISFKRAIQVDTVLAYGDTAWYDYYHEVNNFSSYSRWLWQWFYPPLPYTVGPSSILWKLYPHKDIGRKIVKVYDAPFPLERTRFGRIRLAIFNPDSSKVDSVMDIGYGFAPSIATDTINMYVAYSRDSILVNGDSMVPLIHPVKGSIMLTTLSPYNSDSVISIRELYSTNQNTTMWAVGPVSMTKVGRSIYIAFETFFTRASKRTTYWVDGITLNLLRYDLLTRTVDGPYQIGTITHEWEFSIPDGIDRIMDSLKSVSMTNVGDSVLYLLWTSNFNDTGLVRIYRINLNEQLTSSIPYLFEKRFPGNYVENPFLTSFNSEVNGFFKITDHSNWNTLERIYFQDDTVINPVIEALYGGWNVSEYRSDGRVLLFTANPEGYKHMLYATYPFDTLYHLANYSYVGQPSVLRSDNGDTLFFTFIDGEDIYGYKPDMFSTVSPTKIPDYYIQAGEPVKSPYTVYREGYKIYSPESEKRYLRKVAGWFNFITKKEESIRPPENTLGGVVCYKHSNKDIIKVDYGDSLVYEIKGIPQGLYKLRVTGYQEDEKRVLEWVNINGIPMGMLNLKRGREKTLRRVVFSQLLGNGVLRISINKIRGRKVYV